jgi:hypothetical protein
MRKRKHVDPIPEKFSSYEEAAKFWDTHDTTDYPDAFHDVDVVTKFRARQFEIEIDGDVAQALRTQARRKGITVSRLASDLLRQKLTTVIRVTQGPILAQNQAIYRSGVGARLASPVGLAGWIRRAGQALPLQPTRKPTFSGPSEARCVTRTVR